MAETLENQALHLLGQVVNEEAGENIVAMGMVCLLYTSPSPRDAHESRMPSSA